MNLETEKLNTDRKFTFSEQKEIDRRLNKFLQEKSKLYTWTEVKKSLCKRNNLQGVVNEVKI